MWERVAWEGSIYCPQGSVQGTADPAGAPALLLAFRELSLPPLISLADFSEGASIYVCTHSPGAGPTLSSWGPTLLLGLVGRTLWPVRQNPVPGKGWSRGDPVGSEDLATFIVGPCPWLPPPYKEEVGLSVSKDPSLRYVLT